MEWGGLEANWPKMGEALNSVCASMDANAATQLQQRITNSWAANRNEILNEGVAAPEVVKQGIKGLVMEALGGIDATNMGAAQTAWNSFSWD